jgi:hypothetical protein
MNQKTKNPESNRIAEVVSQGRSMTVGESLQCQMVRVGVSQCPTGGGLIVKAPSNWCVKMQNQFAMSFPMQTLAETSRIVFVALNDGFMAPDRYKYKFKLCISRAMKLSFKVTINNPISFCSGWHRKAHSELFLHL